MGTKIQYQDYTNYIKCGEILKSPLQSLQNSIILKCFKCTDVHFLLESFIAHIQQHFKDVLTLEEQNAKAAYEHTHVEEMETEGLGIDNSAIKLEELDPLFPIKYEMEEEKSNEKCVNDEISSQNSNASGNEFDMEFLDEFGDVYDSADEVHPDDSETGEDEKIKKPAHKKEKHAKDKLYDSESDEEEVTKDSPNKRKINISPTVTDFMKSKTNVLTLIEFYKNQPDLWNKYSPFYRLRDKRKQIFEEITQNINNKCTLQLSWNQTAEIISHICGKHRDDFKRIQGQQTAKKKGRKSNKKQGSHEKNSDKKIKCCWFFEDLHFLRSKVIIRLQTLDSNLPELTSEQIIKILEIYQSFPNLWNTYLIENICSNKRREALTEMLNALEKNMSLKISANALEQYIHTIHNYFSREKRQRLETFISEDLSNSPKNNQYNYYQYMIFLEDHEGPFNCYECNGIYTKPLCFRVHKSQHDGSIPLTCSQCKQEFKSVASYTTHAKRHLEDLQFVCKECNMKFLRHSDLKIHLLTHTDARPYCCEICGASYRQSNSFRKHQRIHEKRFSHKCHICSKGYYTKYRYVDHMNSHMNIRSHVCKICGKGFITSRALKTHSVTHEDARNHACKLCGKTFKLKIGVLQHMRTHGSKVETDVKRKMI